MSRSKLFLILALLIPDLSQAKNIILYDDSNSFISQGYKSINKIGQSVKIDEDYEILNRVQTRAWIRRFDAPDIFPDCGHYEERKPRKKNIYLESGRPCETDGIYRYEDQLNSKGEPKHAGYDDRDDYQQTYVYDLRQQVVLLKGDIAPRFLDFYENAVLKEAKKIKWHLVSEIVRIKEDEA